MAASSIMIDLKKQIKAKCTLFQPLYRLEYTIYANLVGGSKSLVTLEINDNDATDNSVSFELLKLKESIFYAPTVSPADAHIMIDIVGSMPIDDPAFLEALKAAEGFESLKTKIAFINIAYEQAQAEASDEQTFAEQSVIDADWSDPFHMPVALTKAQALKEQFDKAVADYDKRRALLSSFIN